MTDGLGKKGGVLSIKNQAFVATESATQTVFFPKQFTVGVLNAVLSVSALAGVLCPFRWACLPICLPICLPSGFAFWLCWGAVSASLGWSPNLSPNLSRTWLCLSPWLGCWACLPICLPICLPRGFVFHLGWGAVSASLGLSPNSKTVYGWGSQCFLNVSALAGMLCPPRWACLRSCLPACLPSGLGCCVRLAGLVFLLSAVLSPALSAILAGMLCPPCWAVSGLVSQLVSHLVWDAVSASLVLSFSCLRSCLRSCLPSWLGCCVRLAGLSPVLSPSLSPIWSGMLCPPPWSCLSRLWSCLPAFVFVLSRSLSFIWDAVSAPPGLVFFLSLVLFPSLSGMLCSPSWLVSQPSLSPFFCPILFSVCLVCPCSGLVSKISCAICATVWGLRWCNSPSSQWFATTIHLERLVETPTKPIPPRRWLRKKNWPYGALNFSPNSLLLRFSTLS